MDGAAQAGGRPGSHRGGSWPSASHDGPPPVPAGPNRPWPAVSGCRRRSPQVARTRLVVFRCGTGSVITSGVPLPSGPMMLSNGGIPAGPLLLISSRQQQESCGANRAAGIGAQQPHLPGRAVWRGWVSSCSLAEVCSKQSRLITIDTTGFQPVYATTQARASVATSSRNSALGPDPVLGLRACSSTLRDQDRSPALRSPAVPVARPSYRGIRPLPHPRARFSTQRRLPEGPKGRCLPPGAPPSALLLLPQRAQPQ